MSTPLYSNNSGFRAFRRLAQARRQPVNQSVLLDNALEHTTSVDYTPRSEFNLAEWVDSQNSNVPSEIDSFADEASEATEEAIPATAESASTLSDTLADADYGAIGNIVDTGITSLLDNQYSQGLQNQINSVANQKVGPYSFLQTDQDNRVAAMKQQAQSDISTRSAISTARGIGTAISTAFGPEISIPYMIADMIIGNGIEAWATSDDLTKVDYNKVTTYGDFGNDINAFSGANTTPDALNNSVLSTNINSQ